jgi:hypothetical protein
VLTSLGFERAPSEHAVYTRQHGGKRLLLGVYVDDLIITGSCDMEITRFKGEMSSRFSMSDLGLLKLYLGIEVDQKPGVITLKQSAFAKKLLEKSGMADCNPVHVPIEPRLKLSQVSPNPPVDITMYRSIVGSLRYLVHTRPDISFAVGFVSRFMETPTTEHLSVVKQILRYIAGTLNFGCTYNACKDDAEPLIGFSDADHAGDVDDRKSTTGSLFFYGRCPISWQSQKQKSTALSSCQAEYMAASTTSCQAVWLGRLIGELFAKDPSVPILFVDNKAAIQLCKNPVFHQRSKHIELRYHFIRECLDRGQITVEFISTADQLADIFTKGLGRVKFQELRERIGVIDIK